MATPVPASTAEITPEELSSILLFGAYIFRNRHRFFGRDPNVENDNPAARHFRVEVVLIPWFSVTTLILVLLINFWLA
jgi:hypothetical protein